MKYAYALALIAMTALAVYCALDIADMLMHDDGVKVNEQFRPND